MAVAGVPNTEYALTDDGVHIAYQVLGDSGPDIVFSWAAWSNIEIVWEYPPAKQFLERVSRFGRLIMFDKRGTGMSDRACPMPTLDAQIDDAVAVLRAVGSERTHLFAGGDAGLLACTLAASRPEMIASLSLHGIRPRARIPEAAEPGGVEAFVDSVYQRWGHGLSQPIAAPTDPTSRDWWGRLERQSVSKGSIAQLWRALLATDITGILPAVRAPTLVTHRSGDRYVPVAEGYEVAQAIPGAQFVELPGSDHAGWNGDARELGDLVERFITGATPRTSSERMLATVLFSDIVGSTTLAASVGDDQWLRLLQLHHDVVGREIAKQRGTVVKTIGDGVVAIFDGPTRALTAAASVREAAKALDLELTVGLHIGEVEMTGDDIAGLAVHIAARVQGKAQPDQILVSRTVVDLVAGSGLLFGDMGVHTLKGVPGDWQLYELLESEGRLLAGQR